MEGAGCSAHLSPSSVQVLAIVVSDFCSLFTETLTLFVFMYGTYKMRFSMLTALVGLKHWLSSICDCYVLTTDCFD
jgi:hypothetical protein